MWLAGWGRGRGRELREVPSWLSGTGTLAGTHAPSLVLRRLLREGPHVPAKDLSLACFTPESKVQKYLLFKIKYELLHKIVRNHRRET